MIVSELDSDPKPMTGSDGRIVKMNDARSPVRLYLTHTVSGQVSTYRDLATCLAPDIEVFCTMQAPGTMGKGSAVRSVEEAATSFVERIRILHGAGLYNIAGFSTGGHLAYEIARQLGSQSVGFIGLIDCGLHTELLIPNVSRNVYFDRGVWITFLLILFQKTELFLGRKYASAGLWLDPHEFWNLSKRERLQALLAALPVHSPFELWKRFTLPELERYFDFYRKEYYAVRDAYVPKPYAGHIHFFESTETEDSQSKWRWSALALGGCSVIAVPGEHLRVVRGDGAKTLADHIRNALLPR